MLIMVMDQRKSKKTRSYGEPPQDARTSKLSGGPIIATGSGRRSSLNDRNRSTPLFVKSRKEDAEVCAGGDNLRTADQDLKLSGNLQAFVRGDGKPQAGHVSQRPQALRPSHPSRNVSADLFER